MPSATPDLGVQPPNPAAQQRAGPDQRGGDQQRDGDGQGGKCRHAQPFMARSSSGSSVPRRLWIWTASASSSAVTVAPTTTSVSASEATTGSTALVPTGTSKKIGAVPPRR